MGAVLLSTAAIPAGSAAYVCDPADVPSERELDVELLETLEDDMALGDVRKG
jgi:hypothetical protein